MIVEESIKKIFYDVEKLSIRKNEITFFTTDELSFQKLLKLSKKFKTDEIRFDPETYAYGYCDTCGGSGIGNRIYIKNYSL